MIILCFVCLCVFSCQKRDHEWLTFFDAYESYDPNSLLAYQNINNVKDYDTQLMYALSFDKEVIKLSDLIGFDKNILRFVDARNKIQGESYQSARDNLESWLNATEGSSLGHKVLEHEARLIYLEALDNLEDISVMKKHILDGENLSINLPGKLSTYYTVKYLLFRAREYVRASQNKFALALCHQATRLVTNQLPSFKRLNTQVQILRTKYYFNHLPISEFSIIETSFLHILKEKHLDRNSLNNIHSDLLYIYALKGRRSEFDSLSSICLRDEGTLTLKGRDYLMTNLLAGYNIFGTKEYQQKILETIAQHHVSEPNSCDKNNYVFRLFEVDAYFQMGRKVKADSLLANIVVPQNCNKRLIDLISFYCNQTRQKNLADGKDINTIQLKIELLMKSRQLALGLFTGDEEFHLDNFYADNLNSILSLVNKGYGTNVPNHIAHNIINIMDDTRRRDWNREFNSSIESVSLKSYDLLNQVNDQIRDGLRRCSDFKRQDSLGAPFYTDLYRSYMTKDSLVKAMNLTKEWKKPINVNILSQKLIAEKAQVIEFYTVNNTYWVSQFDGLKMHLFKYNKEEFEKQCSYFIDERNSPKIRTKMGFPIKLTYLSSEIKSYAKTYIVSDGIVNKIPFDDLQTPIYIQPSIDAILTQDEVTIPKSNFHIYSFSDEKSRRTKTIQGVGELYHDYEEGLSIHRILNGKPTFFHGAKTTYINFEKSLSQSGLHLTTHAYGDETNRLNSYFYLRDEKALPIKIHLSQVYGFEKTPIFVNLSTCSSGIGTNVNGLGVFSLSRPFFSKGTQTLIKTLWEIDDKTSKTFMTYFYTEWAKGMTVYEALSATKKMMKNSKDYSHPYYWQAFVLEGNPNIKLGR